MDLPFLEAVLQPATRADLPGWTATTAALGGGTWLYSEPQPHLRCLVDLAALGWPALTVDDAGLHIAATCTIATLSRFVLPPEWRAGALIERCCHALLGSFKVWNAATVGGNICLALPAGPMTALAAALGGSATIWCPDGRERQVPVADLVVGDQLTSLAMGEILRSITLPLAGLRRRFAFRQMSLTPLGRSGVLLIGTRDPGGGFSLTITAATTRPVRLEFSSIPPLATLHAMIDVAVGVPRLWFDDIHGTLAWRRHVTQVFAHEIHSELQEGAP